MLKSVLLSVLIIGRLQSVFKYCLGVYLYFIGLITHTVYSRGESDLRSCEVFLSSYKEHRTGVTEGMGSNPVGASDLFQGFLCNCMLKSGP